MKSGILTRIKREIPEGIWSKCKKCGDTTYQHALQRSAYVCPHCGNHFAIGHRRYVEVLADKGSFVELDADIATADPLKFRDHRRYSERIREARKKSGMKEAVHTGICTIGGNPAALAIMDTSYILGSMGGATGEKIARVIDRALADRRALILVCQSGGARMQESTFSLMQMAKISARLKRFANAGGLYITILTDPTYGGVTASFAMLGDITIAEPGARIGFAGQAVIKQFMGIDQLPEGFQIAETVLDHGFVDLVVPRHELPATLARLLSMLGVTDNNATPLAG